MGTRNAFQYQGHDRYTVDGVGYRSTAHVYRAAVERGFLGSEQLITRRLCAGVQTWEALCRFSPAHSAGRRAAIERERAAMRQLIDDLDARKAACFAGR